jgi:hypothetical protein
MLQRNIKGALMAALIVSAISAITASSASAVTFTLTKTACTGGTNVALCYETAAKEKLELIGEQSETVAGGITILDILTTPEQKLECTSATGKGTILQNAPLPSGLTEIDKGTITYSGCKITAPAEIAKKCKIELEKTTNALHGELISEKELTLEPETGTVFIEVVYSNNGGEKCPLTFLGGHNITGKQKVEILNPGVAEETKTGKAIGEELQFFSAGAELLEELILTFTGLNDKVYVSKEA